MDFKKQEYFIGDFAVLGRASFMPPFKANDQLTNEARFVYVVNGRSKLNAPTVSMENTSGEGFLMKCENFVNQWMVTDDGSRVEVIIIRFSPDVLEKVYKGQVPELFSAPTAGNGSPVEKVQPSLLLDNFIQSLRPYLDAPNLINEEFVSLKVRELILVLLNSDTTGNVRTVLGNLFQNNHYEFKSIIASNLYQNLKLDDLAFFAGMSLSSFKRKFSQVYGTSPTQYIKKKRLERAAYLLKNSRDRISDVAYDSGFNDVSYFTKSFAAHFNMSPTDYKKSALA